MDPYLVTPDETGGLSELAVRRWVNGELRQDFGTSDCMLGARDAVRHLNRFCTLHPGDLTAMGPGPGNARSWRGDASLQPGDMVALEIETRGRQK